MQFFTCAHALTECAPAAHQYVRLRTEACRTDPAGKRRFRAYDVRSGQRVYQERVAGGGSFSASPVAADGKLYLTSEDGDIHVVKAGNDMTNCSAPTRWARP